MTTCNNISLADIRKNMLLNGFVIEKETGTDIVTEFKQTDNWHGDRRFVRVNAVDVGEKVFKLKVRIKSIRIHREDHMGMGMTSYGRRSRQSNTVILDFSRPIEVEDEDDEVYYEERRDGYLKLRKDICGG
jgi:hypothetical protein